MPEHDLVVRLNIVDVDDLIAAQEASEATSVDIEETSGAPGSGPEELVGPIVAVLIGAGVLAAAKFLTDWWDRRRGGLVIDGRSGASNEISRDSDVPYGFVVIFPADGGKVTVEVKDAPADSIERLLAKVIESAFATVKAAADAAAALVGKDKVTEEPAGATA